MKNRKFGIEIEGHEGEISLIENSIVENEGDGLISLIGTKPLIQKNEIFKNHNGIALNSCDAKITQNFICSNSKNAVYLFTTDGLLNNSSLRMNHMSNNQLNGVLIEGENALVTVKSNYHISENKGCGIKVGDKAQVEIINNLIYYNAEQGILLQECTVGRIRLNSIFKNFKSNIALGGEYSGDTVIIQNNIHSSPAEGILMINCENSMIYKNEIFNNYDGIVICESCPEIRMNFVRNNATNGILITNSSAPILESNLVEENEIIGILIKDMSVPLMLKNKVENNEVNVASENIPFNYKIQKEEFKGRNIFLNREVCHIF